MTRKIVALLLALIMLASCGAAVAEDVALSNIKHIHTPFGYTDSNGNDVFDHSQWKTTVSATINQSATISANVYLDGVLFSPMQINGVAGGTATVDAGRVDFAWNGVNTDGWHPNQYAGTQTFVVKITDANGKVLGTKPLITLSPMTSASIRTTCQWPRSLNTPGMPTIPSAWWDWKSETLTLS